MIVVTGATGFLGGAVARALVRRGDRVRAIVRGSSGVAPLRDAGIEIAVGDIVTGDGLDAAFAGATTVVHAAGILGRPGARDPEYMRVHVEGTMNVVRAARRAGVSRVLHMSSPGLLGPIARDAPDADEDAPPHPTNPYERSKAAAEAALAEDAHRSGPIAVIVRPEFVHGPGDRHVLRLFQAIAKRRFFYIGGGDTLCHPTYVDDAVSGLLAAADRGQPGRVYLIAGPRPVSFRALAETIARACNVAPPWLHLPERAMRLALGVLEPLSDRARLPLPISTSGVDFFTFDRHFSYQRAKRELGFEPKVELAEGIERTVRWYKTEGLL